MVPQFDAVFVDVAKLRDYCLSEDHPRGRHKARVFRSRLGLFSKDAEELQRLLVTAALDRQSEFHATVVDEYGQRYIMDFAVTTNVGTGIIRAAWIIRAGEMILRLATCYVL